MRGLFALVFQKTMHAAEAKKVQSQRPLGPLFAALVNHCTLPSYRVDYVWATRSRSAR